MSGKKINVLYEKIILISRQRILEALKTITIIKSFEKKDVSKEIDLVFDILEKTSVRNAVQKKTNIRYDRLKEYFTRKREPRLSHFISILKALRTLNMIESDLYKDIQNLLIARLAIVNTINKLNISYNEISRNTNIASATVNYVLNNTGLICSSLSLIKNLFSRL